MGKFRSAIAHAWNAFVSEEEKRQIMSYTEVGASNGRRPDRLILRYSNEKSMLSSIMNRIGIDAAGIPMRHVRVDDDERYQEDMISGLNNCLAVEANIDQAARAFQQDTVMSMLDEGTIAIVPVDTTLDPTKSGSFDVKTLRVGRITTWFPKHVRVNLYNDTLGIRQDVVLEKRFVAIVENPLYAVMNEPNSTLQRLIRKLGLLDVVDEASSSGKLDLIIQLPYVIKSEARKQQAEQRRQDIEFQLKGSKYGIAYTDGTEKITQLNRPAENNLMAQVEYLTTMLYGQLGITDAVLNGTADESTMLNYYNRTIEPILDAISQAMARSFLTNTARTQGQTVMYFRDPFKLVPIGGDGGIADIADKLSRNEIMTANEIRSAIGVKPSKDPAANKLKNPNMPDPAATPAPTPSPAPPEPDTTKEGDSQNGS